MPSTLTTHRTFVPSSFHLNLISAISIISQTNRDTLTSLDRKFPALIQPRDWTYYIQGYNSRLWFLYTEDWLLQNGSIASLSSLESIEVWKYTCDQELSNQSR